MNKYFVTKDEAGFNVTEEAWDSIGGNHYNNVASEFESKEQAQEHANCLNECIK